ncbi:MAG: helix-turn-helix transcriptional regulator [Clostridia bacterium]|nr:helix-turn-helix transcriptional regulator [Clostridia bacterium]
MKLKELREDRDLTQKQIAEILDCKQNTYQQYESGKRQIPLQALVKLCNFYKISADYILGLPKGLSYPERK